MNCPLHGNDWCTCSRDVEPTREQILSTTAVILTEIERDDAKAFAEWWQSFAGSNYDAAIIAKVAFLAGWRERVRQAAKAGAGQ